MKTEETLIAGGYIPGRMISASKSGYSDSHPKNFVIFNGNIISKKEQKKVWHGDLDLTKDFDELKKLAEEDDDVFYFLREMDARFGTENDSYATLVARAVWSTEKDRAPVYDDHFNT